LPLPMIFPHTVAALAPAMERSHPVVAGVDYSRVRALSTCVCPPPPPFHWCGADHQLMWPWPPYQVVFVIISDIGIEKMEAQLVSIKDSLSKDVMLVRRLGRMRAYCRHAVLCLRALARCGYAHTAVYPSGPCCARPLPPTSGSEAASRLAW
jgi:hypothetical protein